MITHEHKAVDGDIYFVAHGKDGAQHIGTCLQGLTMATGQPDLAWSYDPEDLMEQVDSMDFTDWNEVPEQGEQVNRGIYSFNGKLIVCYQSHVRTEHAIEDIPALFGMYRGVLSEWVPPAGGHDAYNTGDEVMFEGTKYRSVIDANIWSPAAYTAGWEVVA